MAPMKRILVSGGAGYIGSHTVRHLASCGHHTIVVDNLSEGHREAVVAGDLEVGDIRDRAFLDEVFSAHSVDAVVHFASLCYVGDSVTDPRRYFEENLGGAMSLLGAMLDHDVKHFVLSSTCATYGDPETVPMSESHPQAPVNPYGETKYTIEKLLAAYERAYGLRSVPLRYFNASGASADGRLGESHDPETHLIPLLLRTALGKIGEFQVFGDDYPTVDGTCIRDYVHVEDLATAHRAALDWLWAGNPGRAFNVGTGRGYSVKEVLAAAEKITGSTIRYRIAPRRDGDPPELVADSRLAQELLDWQPRHSDLENIVGTAWQWETNRRY